MSQAISGMPAIRGTASALDGFGRPSTLVLKTIRWLQREWRIHRDLGGVVELDCRMLADFGGGRGEAEWAARQGRGRGSASRLPRSSPARTVPEAGWTKWR